MMHRSIALLLTCWISLSLQLSSASSSAQTDAHRLARRMPAVARPHPTEARRSTSGPDYVSETYSSTAVTWSAESSVTGALGGSMSQTYSTASAQPSPPAAAAPAPAPSAAPTCDKTNPKAEINRFLVQCDASLQRLSAPALATARSVNQTNVAQLAPQIAAQLSDILGQLKLSLSYVLPCGIDAKPLSNDKGVAISDVSWSAFQVILTLKDLYLVITGLYKTFPAIKAQCSDSLVAISTQLASLIGACGEQINLFDTQFFPLVTPQLGEFTGLPDDFVSFIGNFVS